MSPTPTPGLRPTPCVEAEEESKAEVWGVGRRGPGAGVERQASKVVRHACCRGQGFPSLTGIENRTEKALDHRATDPMKALLHPSL